MLNYTRSAYAKGIAIKTVPGKRAAIRHASETDNRSSAKHELNTAERESVTPVDMSQQDTSASESALRDQIVAALKTIYDPELPVNIYELGLIYGIDILPLGRVVVKMTLTSPACPVAGSLPGEVEVLVRAVRGVNEAEVQLVWDPPWSPDLLSEDTKLELNLL